MPVNPAWIAQVNAANKVDLDPVAGDLARLAITLEQEQHAAARARLKEFTILGQAG
jgi:hypothetical protein